jgi:hypothetical protein
MIESHVAAPDSDAAADLALRRRVLKGMVGRALRDVAIERLLRARPPLGADE